MTIESMDPDEGDSVTRSGDDGVVALTVFYVLGLLAGPPVALLVWIQAFGLWGTDDPVQPGAIAPLVLLAIPVILGIALGMRARSGSRVTLVAPGILVALAALVPIVTRDVGALVWPFIAAVYAFGPVGIGRIVRRLRRPSGSPRSSR